MDPERTEDQAKALAATRRVPAVMRLEAAGGEEALLSDRDQEFARQDARAFGRTVIDMAGSAHHSVMGLAWRGAKNR